MMASRKSTSVLALEFGPSTIRFVEMQVGGNPENQVLSAGVLPLEAGDDLQTHVERLQAVLARIGTPAAVIASLPLRHAFLRLVDLPENTGDASDPDDVQADLRWEMAQYLARPLDQYALDFQAQGSRYLVAAYRLSEVETLRAALAEAGAPAATALDLDALAILHAFTANYPECLGERTLIIKADAQATTLFRTKGGEYLGGTVLRENGDTPFHTFEPHERAEHLLHRARMITLGFGGILGRAPEAWSEAERIFLCGDLAGSADFRELLKTNMSAPFALLNPFRKIPGPNPEVFPVAYPGAPFAATVGLALRAVAERTTPERQSAASATPRLNLLRHVATSQSTHAGQAKRRAEKPAKAPRPPRDPAAARAARKRVLIALALLILAVAAGVGLHNPEWVTRQIPAQWTAAAPAPVAPDTDSLQRTLESEASQLVAHQQRAVIAWLRETEPVLPTGVGLAALTTTQTASHNFVIRGLSPSQESLSALQEMLVLVPGLDLRRSEVRAFNAKRDRTHIAGTVEFLFSGAFTASQDTSSASVDAPVATRVLAANALGDELQRFLDAAAFAGIPFTHRDTPVPTTAGALRAIPYHLTAPCTPALLREFLENEHRRDSPFGIQRVLWENHPDSSVVFLDIMAFSR